MNILKWRLKLLVIMLSMTTNCTIAQITTAWRMQSVPIQTIWAKDVSPKNALPEYPRPQLMRKGNWQNLNGLWEYAITDTSSSIPNTYQGRILVPYPIESALSGVQKALLPSQILWYKKILSKPSLKFGERLLLNFGAIDWQATIFVNGKEVGKHSGGYTSFSLDVTDNLTGGDNELVIKVFDPTDMGINPHGKQTLHPANIYYTASSGIWQTVWLETVNPIHISELRLHPSIDKGSLFCNLICKGTNEDNLQAEIIISSNGKLINKTSSKWDAVFGIKIPNFKLWSPENPFLYDLTIKLIKEGKVVDEVFSYFGMRKIAIQKDKKGIDRIFLNNKPYFNLGVLDQGFWPEGLYTAPTDAALKFDITAIKAMGFNTIRKHIKVEPARWYFYADKLGLLVWQDFVNPPHALPEGAKLEFEKETEEIINQFRNFTCITTWVLFNERWGAYDQQRLTEWVRIMDSNRIVNGHTGELLFVNNVLRTPSLNPYLSSDMTDVHAYPNPMLPVCQKGKAMVCGEFGGVGVSVPNHQWSDLQGWGYIQVLPKELESKYGRFIDTLIALKSKGLSASIYTEPFDVEGEENGLLTYDRKIIKVPVVKLRNINIKMVDELNSINTSNSLVTVKDIDINDGDNRYPELMGEYMKGKRDSFFLRRLTLMAMRIKEQDVLTEVGNSYIKQLKNVYSTANLQFISSITRTSKDDGFNLFLINRVKVDSVLGGISAENKIRGIIKRENIDFYLSNTENQPDWDQISTFLKSRYGVIGEEKAYGEAMIYFLEKRNWKQFGKYYALYYNTAISRSEYDINNVTWLLFENVNDRDVLEVAKKTMKYNIENELNDSHVFDTYANLLYKLGKYDEALHWERKAVQLAPNSEDIAENFRKMKDRIPTWN